jgi:hypothetical protein
MLLYLNSFSVLRFIILKFVATQANEPSSSELLLPRVSNNRKWCLAFTASGFEEWSGCQSIKESQMKCLPLSLIYHGHFAICHWPSSPPHGPLAKGLSLWLFRVPPMPLFLLCTKPVWSSQYSMNKIGRNNYSIGETEILTCPGSPRAGMRTQFSSTSCLVLLLLYL